MLVTLMIASLGSLMIGSATSSTETSRKPCQVTAFISASRYGLRQSSLVRCEPACGPICSMPPSTTHDAPVT